VTSAVAQLTEVRIRQLDRMLEAERRMRAIAEQQADAARAALYAIAESFCSQELDAVLRERKSEVQGWSPEQTHAFIVQHLSPRINRMEAGDRLGELYEAAQQQVAELENRLAEANRIANQRELRIQQLEGELGTTREALRDANRRLASSADTPAAASAAATGTALPEPVRVVRSPGLWFDEWQQHKQYERSRDLIHLIGESGISQRAALRERLNEMWNTRSKGPTIQAVNLSRDTELLEILEPKSGRQGRPPQLLKLTERGREAFLILFSKEAVPSELDELVKRHKSLEHALLNLEAAAMLRERLNASVDMYPPTIVLDGGRQFAPDLAVTLPDGEVIYVECERGTNDDYVVRDRKWQNIYDATGGKIYVICSDYDSRGKVTSEISRWSGTRQVTVRATDLTTLNKRDDQFWFYQRPRGRRDARR
jgi:hypothetical protein